MPEAGVAFAGKSQKRNPDSFLSEHIFPGFQMGPLLEPVSHRMC